MLKEFDLDAPDQTKETRYEFRMQTRCVTALYERRFTAPKSTGKEWKILVEVVRQVTKPKIRDLLGVLTVQLQGDVGVFLSLPEAEKKRQTLKWLSSGIRMVADDAGWPLDSFRTAEGEVIRLNYVNSWIWKTPKPNPLRTVTAEVFVEHHLTEVLISIRFRTSAGALLNTERLIADIPTEFAFIKYFGKLQWKDNETVELISKDGKQTWQAKVSTFGMTTDLK